MGRSTGSRKRAFYASLGGLTAGQAAALLELVREEEGEVLLAQALAGRGAVVRWWRFEAPAEARVLE